jgi:hypothetical protein
MESALILQNFRCFRHNRGEFVNMRGGVKLAIFTLALAGAVAAGRPPAAMAAGFDGNWSVLIITEKGDCDTAYRYAVGVTNGQIRYVGDAAIDMTGTVTPAGAVKVSIRLGDKGANGTGHLNADTGSGRWQGAAGTGASCAGRWEAERR